MLRTPVFEVLGRSFANTLVLAGAAVLLCTAGGVAVGWPAACGAARLDGAAMLLIRVGHNFPVFWSGLLLIWVFGVKLQWFPVSGMYDMRGEQDWSDLLHHWCCRRCRPR